MTAETVATIAAKFDWDQIAGGVVNNSVHNDEDSGLYLAEFERIKAHDEKIMMLFRDDDIVAVTIKIGEQIGRAPEDASPAEMFVMVVSAMATI